MPTPRSWRIVPASSPISRILKELSRLGNNHDGPAFVHGQFGKTQLEHAVAKSIEPVAIDVGDRAAGRNVKISAHQRDNNIGSGLKRRAAGFLRLPLPRVAGPASDSLQNRHAHRPELRRENSSAFRGEIPPG